MREQMMREQDRLRVLQVGPARHRDTEVLLGLLGEGIHLLEQQAADDPAVLTQVALEQRGDLVVPGPSGPQPATQLGPEQFEQTALQ